MRKLLTIAFLLLSSIALLGQGRGTPSSLVVKTDANGYLLVTSATQTNPITQGVFTSRVLRTDASGSLQVVLTGTVTPTYPQSVPASTCAAPSLGMSGGATTGIAFTATPSILLCIAGTAEATLTGTGLTVPDGVTVTGGNSFTDTSNGGGTFIGSGSPVQYRRNASTADADIVAGSAVRISIDDINMGATTFQNNQLGSSQTTDPTCTANCGTSPSVVGTDNEFRVTMGAAGAPASGWVITFNGTWSVAPVCSVTMGLAGMVVGKLPLTAATTATTMTVVTNGTAPGNSDVYNVICRAGR